MAAVFAALRGHAIPPERRDRAVADVRAAL